MKVTLRDVETLSSLRPLEISAYLKKNGWIEVEYIEGRSSTWIYKNDNLESELLLPMQMSFRDYALRISDALKVLEYVESRSQLEIFMDIKKTYFDVFRIRVIHDKANDGTIGLEDGVSLLTHTYELFIAAACAANKPKAIYPTRKPGKVEAYMKKVRLGHTERGSFVIAVFSPVTPELTQEIIPDLGVETEIPFERKVTLTLMKTANTLLGAIEKSSATGSMKPFLNAVPEGLSANFCDAIVGLQEKTNATQLTFNMTWAPVRPVKEDVESKISITEDSIPILREASTKFKIISTKKSFLAQGIITDLHLNEDDQSGKVRIGGLVDGVFKKIEFELPLEEYNKAILAHHDRNPIICEGDLIKEGKIFHLKNPRNFKVESS